MKANQRTRENDEHLRDPRDEGLIGIGTMIVFIAAVIVAAIAAAVIINTAGNLQRKASETGKETTSEVAGNLFVRNVIGNVTADQKNIQKVYWYLSLAPGANPIDLNTTIVQWTHGDNLFDLNVTSEDDCDDTDFDSLSDGFCVRDVFDAGDNSINVLSEGDKVRVEVHLLASEHLGPRENVEVMFMPEAGSPADASFKTPPSFGRNGNIGLI